MLAMTLANSNAFPMESLMVPRTLMLWAESEKESINKRKVKVLFIGWFFTAFNSNSNNSQSLILLDFHHRGGKVFRKERRAILLSLRVLRLLRALCVKLIFNFSLESSATTSTASVLEVFAQFFGFFFHNRNILFTGNFCPFGRRHNFFGRLRIHHNFRAQKCSSIYVQLQNQSGKTCIFPRAIAHWNLWREPGRNLNFFWNFNQIHRILNFGGIGIYFGIFFFILPFAILFWTCHTEIIRIDFLHGCCFENDILSDLLRLFGYLPI